MTTAQTLRRLVGRVARPVVHTVYDAVDGVQGSRPPLVPPRRLNPNVGLSPSRTTYWDEFVSSGAAIRDLLVGQTGLRPDGAVLDIGCGIGRVARALTGHLGPDGRYSGFDADGRAVAWCRATYGPLFPQFDFTHAPLEYVNVRGRDLLRPEAYRFPYDDETFDVAFSISVYTHLHRAAVQHYLEETARVLKPGGCCLNTFFVADDVAIEAMESGRADRSYAEYEPGVFAEDPEQPNLGVAFTVAVLNDLHASAGLEIDEPIRFGSWSGRQPLQHAIYQDAVVARRPR